MFYLEWIHFLSIFFYKNEWKKSSIWFGDHECREFSGDETESQGDYQDKGVNITIGEGKESDEGSLNNMENFIEVVAEENAKM